jgi:ELWxxDGT repeat protein
VDVGGTLYFTTTTGPIQGLWKTDGTAAGTALLLDTSTNPANLPSSLIAVGNTLYFVAGDAAAGRELWKTDGVTTVRVADIKPGSASSNPSNFTSVGATLYFTADDGTHGVELWKSDALGTSLVRDINPNGTTSSAPGKLTAAGNRLYFLANDGSHGQELWEADPANPAGASLVADINPNGTASSSPASLTNVNGTLFFTANDGSGVNGGTPQLWCTTDGTPGGTLKLTTNFSSFSSLTAFNGKLYFSAADATHGRELFASDGTVLGTSLVKDLNSGTASSSPANLLAVGGTLYFTATEAVDGTELWKSDGSGIGTQLVADLRAGSASSSPSGLVNVNGTLFFQASDASGLKIWKTDGSAAGTSAITASALSTAPGLNVAAGGRYFFTLPDPISGTRLWSGDGTPGGAAPCSPAFLNPISVQASSNGLLYFAADDGFIGEELWRSDGTSAGTAPVADLNISATVALPRTLTTFNGNLYFTSDQGGLYRSDGTLAGSVKLANVTPTHFMAVGNTLFFAAGDSTNNPTLWKTDGTSAGTVPVRSFPLPSGYAASIGQMASFNARLYFTAAEAPAQDGTLWNSDGTTGGTQRVQSGSDGPLVYAAGDFAVVGNAMYFYGNDGTHGFELWKTDGTSAGTAMVKDIQPGASSSAANGAPPTVLRNLNGTLLFPALTGNYNFELWKSDGSDSGTSMVIDLDNTPNGSFQLDPVDKQKSLVVMGNFAYFFALNALWRTDGTAAGTTQVSSFGSATSLSLSNLTRIGSSMLMFASQQGNEYDLWRSDGTPAGTTLVKRFFSDGSSSAPCIGPIVDLNGRAFFPGWNATDGTGVELWESDGTPAGTACAGSITPGTASTAFADFTPLNGILYFTADDSLHGRLLWQATPATIPPPPTLNPPANVSAFRVDLSWTDNSGGAASFRIERSTDAGFASIDGTAIVGPGVTSYTDSMLLPGTQYYFRISAFTAAGSAPSTSVDVTTPPATYPPGLSLVGPSEWRAVQMVTAFRRQVFFNAYSDTKGWGLVRSDGTNTVPLLTNGATAAEMAAAGNTLFFIKSATSQLWKTDGTVGGTVLIKAFDHTIDTLTVVNDHLYFRYQGTSPASLYTSDGTEAGTVPASLGSDPRSQIIQAQIIAGNKPPDYAAVDNLTFSTAFGTGGWQAHAVDNVTGADLTLTSAQVYSPHNYVNAYGTVYFLAGNPVTPLNSDPHIDLWKSDGTPEGTQVVYDLGPFRTTSAGYLFPGNLCVANGTLIFSVANRVYASDGTTAGTAKIFDAGGNPGADYVSAMTTYAGRAYFTTENPTLGPALMTTDGTSIGTVPVSGMGVANSGNLPFADVGGTVFFGGNLGGSYGLLHLTPDATPLAAPAAPSNLSATAYSAGEIDLAWSDNARNEEGFRIERSTSPTFDTIDATLVAVPNSTFYIDTTVSPGVTYYYRIAAFNDGGATAPLAAAAPVTTPIAGVAAPTGLVAVNAIPGEAVDLSWTSHSGGAETSFVLQRSANRYFYPSGTIDLEVMLPPTTTTYRDATVTRLSRYYYRVFAVSAAGMSAATSTVLATPESRPVQPPTKLQASGVAVDEIDLQWQDNAPNEDAANGYRIERAGSDGVYSEIAQLPANSTSYSDTHLPLASAFTYRVRAVNSVGASAYVTSAVAQTLPPNLSAQVATLPYVSSTTSATNADPSQVFLVNGRGLFFAVDYSISPQHVQIWSTDGTKAGSSMVQDLGPASAGPIATAGGFLYFIMANPGSSVFSLWRTDGTVAGTVPLFNNLYTIDLGLASNPSIHGSIDFNGRFFFTVAWPHYGQVQLYTSDGTAAGTSLVHTFSRGAGANFVSWNGTLYLVVDGVVYKTDGTDAGTVTTSDFVPGLTPQAVERVVTNDKVFYVNSAGDLIVSNGSPGSEQVLANGAFGLTVVGNKVAFQAGSGAPGYYTLYATDGTPGAVVNVGTFFGALGDMTAVGDRLYFNIGNLLYWSDLTSGGYTLVGNILGPPSQLAAIGNTLTFKGGYPNQLWTSDGTLDGTFAITNIGAITVPAHPDWITTVNGITYFISSSNQFGGAGAGGPELWRTDGTPAGTFRIFADGASYLTDFNGVLYFLAGSKLYKTDGTIAGTQRVQDLSTITGTDSVRLLAVFNGYLYFAHASVFYPNMWYLCRTDGTPNGAQPFGSGSVRVNTMQVSGNYLFFTDGTNTSGGLGNLWRTDGDPAPAHTVQLPLSGRLRSMLDVDGTLYVVGGALGPLYKIDPGSLNPVDLHDFVGFASILMGNLTRVGNQVYFSAEDPQLGATVWKSDGTAAGTVEVFDPSTDNTSSFSSANVWSIVDVGGTAYVLSADSQTPVQPGPSGWLWKSDGTAAGTVRIRPVNVPTWQDLTARPLFATAVAGKLVYSDGEHLWRSDGTAAGTIQIDEVGTSPSGTHSIAGFGGPAFSVVQDRIYYTGQIEGNARDLRVATLTPPSPPANLSISPPAGAAAASPPPAGGGVHLAWVDNATNETAYIIERSSSPAFATIDRTFFAPADSTSYTDSTAAPGQYYYRVRAANAGGVSANSNVAGGPGFATIKGRYVFYNDSFFDGNDAGASATDDAAIATDKSALLPGQTATAANLTNFSKGINGVMIDIAGLTNPAALAKADFSFRAGTDGDPRTWVVAPDPTQILVRPGAGVGGADRIEIIWPDNAIADQWLQITVNATANTALAGADVFYFGNLVGDSNGNGSVTVADVAMTKSLQSQDTTTIVSPVDFNRSGQITVADVAIAKAHQGHSLALLTAPPPTAAAPAAAAVELPGSIDADSLGTPLGNFNSTFASADAAFPKPSVPVPVTAIAVQAATPSAAAQALRGNGPQLIEGRPSGSSNEARQDLLATTRWDFSPNRVSASAWAEEAPLIGRLLLRDKKRSPFVDRDWLAWSGSQ